MFKTSAVINAMALFGLALELATPTVVKAFEQESQPVKALKPSTPEPTKVAMEVMRLEFAAAAALQRRDTAWFAARLAEGSEFIEEHGRRLTRTEYLARLVSEAGLQEVRDDLQVRPMADGAVVVTGRRTTQKGDESGRRFSFSHVWVKRTGEWQLIVAQETVASELSPPSAPNF